MSTKGEDEEEDEEDEEEKEEEEEEEEDGAMKECNYCGLKKLYFTN